MSDRESNSSRSLSPGEARSPTPQRRMSDSPKPRSASRSADSPKSEPHRQSPPPRSHSRSRSPRYRRGRRYRSRTRSRSPRESYRDNRRRRSSRYSRSRSRSYSPSGYRRGRSPMSSRRRHVGTREAPRTSRCLGVFGLSLYTQERELREMFSRYGPVEEVQVVYDHQSGRSRGFAFLYMRNLEDAVEARERAPGTEIDGRKIRVDYSITERAHTPTPGIYLGKPTSRGYRGDRGDRGYRGRSPSPYYGRRGGGGRYTRSRSRSRSYSPRDEE